MTLRLLITNPDNVNVWPSVYVRAIVGSVTAPRIMGTELLGRWNFNRIFKTLVSNTTYYLTESDTTNSIMNKPLSHDSTTYSFYNNYFNFSANTYVIIAFPIHTAAYGETATFVPNSGVGSDYFVVNYATNNRVVYVLRKWTSAQNAAFNINVGYFKVDHLFSNSQTAYIFMADGYSRRIDYSIDNSDYLSSRSDNTSFYSISINKLDVATRSTNTQGWQYLNININSFLSMNSHIQN